MANQQQVDIVLQGAEALASWRERNLGVRLDLQGADLRRADLVRANLNGADLRDANLEWADLRWADLIETDLSGAYLSRADFHKADLAGSRLTRANLSDANLEDANCRQADLDSAIFSHTRLINTDLAGAKGLSETKHAASSVVDVETIEKSGHLATEFLRGCGLSDAAIRDAYHGAPEALESSLAAEGDYFSCFISFASRDEAFVTQLRHDLQEQGVRCWYSPQDMRTGDRVLDTIYDAIRRQEKLLLVLSEHSVASEWVRDEVERAFFEERERGDSVIFPIKIDDAVLRASAAWAQKVREGRHIGDFRNWRANDAYKQSLEELLIGLHREELRLGPSETALLSEPALAVDWNRPEEDIYDFADGEPL